MQKLLDWFEAKPRPAQLLMVVCATLVIAVILDFCRGWDVSRKLLFPADKTVADVRFWSALVYAVAFSLGLPVAFILWHWRDKNVTDQIDNARKDINLKEFQEVQLRAAGALDEQLPESAREQLQIAALHQLRGFLRGDYGDSFKRPAFEMLLAGHAAAIDRIGVPEVQKQIPSKTREQIHEAVQALLKKLTAIDRTRMMIIRDESEYIFTKNYPLYGRRFDLLDLSRRDLQEGTDYSESHFFGAVLFSAVLKNTALLNAHLEGADLRKTELDGANLSDAHLEGAYMSFAYLEGATMIRAHLEGALLGAFLSSANLASAHLKGAFLIGAHLEGANLHGVHLEGVPMIGAHLEGATLDRALFDNDTVLTFDWDRLSPQERIEHQQILRELGARHVDDPNPDVD